MKQAIFQKGKTKYVSPKIDVIRFSSADIITVSGGDANQGEWDPQPVNDSGSVRWGDMK